MTSKKQNLNKIRITCLCSLYGVLVEKSNSDNKNQLLELTKNVEKNIAEKASKAVSSGLAKGNSWEICYKTMMKDKIVKVNPSAHCEWFPIEFRNLKRKKTQSSMDNYEKQFAHLFCDSQFNSQLQPQPQPQLQQSTQLELPSQLKFPSQPSSLSPQFGTQQKMLSDEICLLRSRKDHSHNSNTKTPPKFRIGKGNMYDSNCRFINWRTDQRFPNPVFHCHIHVNNVDYNCEVCKHVGDIYDAHLLIDSSSNGLGELINSIDMVGKINDNVNSFANFYGTH